MRRIVFPLLLGIVFLTLQTTLLTSLPIQRIRPDIILILILYLGLFYPPISGGILALFMGFLMDLFSGNVFRPLHPLQTPHLLCGPVFQGAVLFGKFHIPIPFRLHLWPGGRSSHPHPSECPQSRPYRTTSIPCYLPSSFPSRFSRV